MASSQKPKLVAKEAFLHVINDHRWLVAGGCSWNLLMANNGANSVRSTADALLPDVIVAVRDCVLLQGRSLIDFYTKSDAVKTDILLCDFDSLSIQPALKTTLKGYKKSIEVHLLHLTAWRDLNYRTQHAIGKDANATNQDRNKDIASLVDAILAGLKDASATTTSKWAKPFADLHAACDSRYRDKSFCWPKDLAEKPDVDKYLIACGL